MGLANKYFGLSSEFIVKSRVLACTGNRVQNPYTNMVKLYLYKTYTVCKKTKKLIIQLINVSTKY